MMINKRKLSRPALRLEAGIIDGHTGLKQQQNMLNGRG